MYRNEEFIWLPLKLNSSSISSSYTTLDALIIIVHLLGNLQVTTEELLWVTCEQASTTYKGRTKKAGTMLP